MTRNEARGILIRMQSEIENPYSTEAQALGIAIEKLMRDYETEYWESQWKIDEYVGSLDAASVARKELEKLYTELYAEYLDLQRTHEKALAAFADTCKVENRPVDERNDEERIIYRLGKIEAQMDDLGCSVEYLKGVTEAQAERLAKIRKAFNE